MTLLPPRCRCIYPRRRVASAPEVRGDALALQAGAQLLDGLGQRVRARLRLAQPPAEALACGRARALLRLHLSQQGMCRVRAASGPRSAAGPGPCAG